MPWAALSLLQKRDLAPRLTLASLLALILLMAGASFSGDHPERPWAAYFFVITLKTLPLLCFLPGLLQRRAMTGLWLALLLLPYFCLAVLYAFGPGIDGVLGLLQAVLIAFCFWVALLFTRWQRALDANP